MLGLLRFSFCLLICLGTSFVKADILPIQSFKTPTGLEVWLVEDKTSPIVSLVITFEKSKLESPFTPSALLLQQSLSDGSGIMTPLKMNRFRKETPSLGVVNIGMSKAIIAIKTTKEGLADSLKMWSQLITAPQFQKTELGNSKTQAETTVSHLKEDLDSIVFLNLLKEVFPHISSLPGDFDKIAKIIPTITPEDLDKELAHQFLTAKPKIVCLRWFDDSALVSLLRVRDHGSLSTKPDGDLSKRLQPAG